jgi:hypothetical protein
MESNSLNNINENKMIDISTLTTYLDEITMMSSKMEILESNQDKILSMLEKLNSRITGIEEKLKEKTDNKIEEDSSYLKELKKETIELNENIVMTALSFRDYRSVIHIFRNYYKTKTDKKYCYPIRIVSKRSFDFYENGKWNNDLYGHISTNTLINNIQNLFMKHNSLENENISENDFILNQDFIYKLSDEKFKKDIFKNVIEEVRINNL